MEAEGFEPSSRENCEGGLYMLRRFFDLDADDENRHPSPASSRLYLAITPTSERESQPAFLSYPDADTSGYAERPKLGSETNGSSIETDAANNTVISSYVLHRGFYQANCASWACHRQPSDPVDTSRPRGVHLSMNTSILCRLDQQGK